MTKLTQRGWIKTVVALVVVLGIGIGIGVFVARPKSPNLRLDQIRTYLALKPREPNTFRLGARLSDFPGFDFDERYLAIQLIDSSNESMYAYVLRGSPLAERVVNLLKGGGYYAVVVTVQQVGSTSREVALLNISP